MRKLSFFGSQNQKLEPYVNLETKTNNDSYIYQNIISYEKQKVECA